MFLVLSKCGASTRRTNDVLLWCAGHSNGVRRAMSTMIPSTMKAVVVRETGNANVLKVEKDHPTPTIKPGEVLVKNEYAGINFIDTYHRSGLYARDLPFICGQEGGGTVVAVSSSSSSSDGTGAGASSSSDDDDGSSFQVGDRVAYSAFGSYAEYTAVPAEKLIPVPSNMTTDVATACIVQGLTAHYLTTSAHANLITAGEWCLIHGVAGGTCQWAAQMAKLRGFKVIGTAPAGKQQHGDIAERLDNCCDELILLDEVPGTSYEDYDSVDIVRRVMDITSGEGVKCVIDGIGKSTVDISIDSLSRRGIFISFGNASGAVPAFPVLRLVSKSAYVTRPILFDYVVDRNELLWRAEEVFDWLSAGKITISVDTTFSLDDAPEGHLYLEAGKSKGKLLYRI